MIIISKLFLLSFHNTYSRETALPKVCWQECKRRFRVISASLGYCFLTSIQNNVSDALFSKFRFNSLPVANINYFLFKVVKFKLYSDERNGFQSHEFPMYRHIFFWRKMKFIILYKIHEVFGDNFLKMNNIKIITIFNNYC